MSKASRKTLSKKIDRIEEPLLTERLFSRRKFLQASSLGVLGLTAACAGPSSSAPKPEVKQPEAETEVAKPNVLFLAVDDLNTWLYGRAGYPKPITPNFDKLVSRSTKFEKAYCPAPHCNPSRCAVLTGIRPSSSGIYSNAQAFRDSPTLENAVTIPEHFAANDYKVLGTGKVFHRPELSSFKDFYDDFYGPYPEAETLPRNGMAGTDRYFDWGALDIPQKEMGDWRAADWAATQLLKYHEQPLFLAYGINKPHLPWYAPKKYFDMYPLESIIIPQMQTDDLADIPKRGVALARPEDDHALIKQYGSWKEAIQAYLACMSFFDDCLGKVLDALETSTNKDNTMIVLWADHGFHLGEKEHWRKATLWEESCHIPMLISTVGQTSAKLCPSVVSSLDLYPTLIELCKLSPKEGLEGKSLTPLLTDPQQEWDQPVVTTQAYQRHAVRSNRWRYIRYDTGEEELYDHDNDPNEWTNLARNSSFSGVKAELSKFLPTLNVRLKRKNERSETDLSEGWG